jgi:hypothetical protein
MSKIRDKALSRVEESVAHYKFIIEKQITMLYKS